MDLLLQRFLHPPTHFSGPCTPERLLFHANLQEFAQRVGYISSLHTGGKLSSDEAFQQVNQLWDELRCCKKISEAQTKRREHE